MGRVARPLGARRALPLRSRRGDPGSVLAPAVAHPYGRNGTVGQTNLRSAGDRESPVKASLTPYRAAEVTPSPGGNRRPTGFVREYGHQISLSFGPSEISPISMFASLGATVGGKGWACRRIGVPLTHRDECRASTRAVCG